MLFLGSFALLSLPLLLPPFPKNFPMPDLMLRLSVEDTSELTDITGESGIGGMFEDDFDFLISGRAG